MSVYVLSSPLLTVCQGSTQRVLMAAEMSGVRYWG